MQNRAVLLLAAILGCSTGLALPGVALAQPAREEIGFFKVVRGEVQVVRAGKQIPAKVGEPVLREDTLVTGPGGSVGVTFVDGTAISLGPDTEYRIDGFAFRPQQNQLSFAARMARGTLHCVSGGIAKLAPDKVTLTLPSGTLGVRGTRYLVKVAP